MFVNLKIILFLLMIIKTCVILLIYLLESIQHVNITCIGARFFRIIYKPFRISSYGERERERRERERERERKISKRDRKVCDT